MRFTKKVEGESL